MCATPLAPTEGTTLGQVPSRSRSSAERLTRPEWCALSSLPFYTAARGTRGWLPTVLHSQNEECMCVCVCMCVSLSVCGRGQWGASRLCALSFFMLPALIFSLISSSHTLPAPQASGLHTDRGAGEGWEGDMGLPLTQTLLVLSIQREVQGELPMGHSHRVQSAVGGGVTRS